MDQTTAPTVEEILESIKQVIALDNRANAADLRRERETRGVAEDDVLDLASAASLLDEPDGGEARADEPGGPLLGETTRAGISDSFAALAMLAQPGARPQIVRSGETSVESLVRELLRPALAEWLERNLPPLVESMVADEIRRIAGKKG